MKKHPGILEKRTCCANNYNLRAFTLGELLVVIAILSILSALLFPALASTKSQAKDTVCASQLRQLVTASFIYAADTDDRLPPFTNSEPYLETWEFGPGTGLPTVSTHPAQLKSALMPYVRDDAVWFCTQDKYSRTTAYKDSIRHEHTSYFFLFYDPLQPGLPFAVDMTTVPGTRMLMGDASAPEPDQNCTSNHPTGSVNTAFADGHMRKFDCNVLHALN